MEKAERETVLIVDDEVDLRNAIVGLSHSGRLRSASGLQWRGGAGAESNPSHSTSW